MDHPMKTPSIALLLLTTGCGPAFSERFFDPPPQLDGGSPSTVEGAAAPATTENEAAAPDASPKAETPDAPASLPPSFDAAPVFDAGIDAPSSSPPDTGVCTPFTMQGVACNIIYDIPRYVGGWYNNKCVGIVQNTPPQCMCKETYNCECFKAAGICKSNFACNSLYGAPQLAACNDNLPQGTP
jgi:hypothetical protein